MPRFATWPAQGFGWRDDGVGTVRPHPTADAARLRQIFVWQAADRFDLAARATASLGDRSLLGDVLADRSLSTLARPDQPDTGAIRRLLQRLTQARAAAPAGAPSPELHADHPTAAPEEADPAERAFARTPMLDRTVAARLAGATSGARGALRLVAATRFTDPRYAALLRAEIAQALFAHGEDRLALRTARVAIVQSHGEIGLAGYVAGLAAWRQGNPALAAEFFEQASGGALTAASTRAGAAFWAARAHQRLGDQAGCRLWLRRSAESSHTFYGMLAARMLRGLQDRLVADPLVTAGPAIADRSGMLVPTVDTHLPAALPILGEADLEAVAATPEGRHAFELLQIGQGVRAKAALLQLWSRAQGDAALCRSIALVAQAAGLSEPSAQWAWVSQSRDGQPPDDAGFPVPRLRPALGFTVNPALVYALTRLESNFDPHAVSGVGAHGLMQIMPVTARVVLGRTPHGAGSIMRALRDPGTNLEIGQRYLTGLAVQEATGGDLIRLLASYNAGPSAVSAWSAGRPASSQADPLLFIESLPSNETRDFVHRALCYLWIYDWRLGMPAPSLDTLAAGGWPRFIDEQKLASPSRRAPQQGGDASVAGPG